MREAKHCSCSCAELLKKVNFNNLNSHIRKIYIKIADIPTHYTSCGLAWATYRCGAKSSCIGDSGGAAHWTQQQVSASFFFLLQKDRIFRLYLFFSGFSNAGQGGSLLQRSKDDSFGSFLIPTAFDTIRKFEIYNLGYTYLLGIT